MKLTKSGSPLLSEVSKCLWAYYKGKIKSSKPIKIQKDHSKPLPKSPQYPLKPEAILGFSPTV